MTMKRRFFLSKKGGTFASISIERLFDSVRAALAAIPNGEYQLTLERRVMKRSANQNAMMWAWFACIAQAWSEAYGKTFTAQDAHDAYCLLLLPTTTPKGRVGGRTSALTTEQMTEFLDKVQADAASELGITLPTPADAAWEYFAKEYGAR